MLLAGDEFGRTQHGNNNAYCQDGPISWVDWSLLGDPNDAPTPGNKLYAFTQKLAKLRHDYPILRRERFLTGHYSEELDVKDVSWLRPDGKEMQDGDWSDGNALTLAVLLDGRAQATGIKRRGSDTTLLLCFNSYYDMVRFKLPKPAGGADKWVRLLDTNQPEADDGQAFKLGHDYDVTGRSVVIFKLLAKAKK